MDIPLFRTEFPEFADTTVYPTPQILMWSVLAEKMVLENIWGDCRQLGVNLYVAHELTISHQNQKAAKVGGTPGLSGGIANSKTVGSASVSYDSTGQSEKDAGWWNRSTYGQQFFRLIKVFGAGAVQL